MSSSASGSSLAGPGRPLRPASTSFSIRPSNLPGSSSGNHYSNSSYQHAPEDTLHRDRSGSGTILPPLPGHSSTSSIGMTATGDRGGPSSRQQGSQIQLGSGQATAEQSTRSEVPSVNSSHAHEHRSIALDELLSQHANSSSRALDHVTNLYNQLCEQHNSDRAERSRLQQENAKLWTWVTGLKKERDALQKEARDVYTSQRDLRYLANRITDLESVLSANGLPIPASSRDRLSPAESMHASTSRETDQSGSKARSGRDLYSAVPRRPSNSPRSTSDSVATFPSSSATGRDRQRSGDTLSNSTSIRSFVTASSDSLLPPSLSTASSTTSLATNSRHRIEREREQNEKRVQHGTSTLASHHGPSSNVASLSSTNQQHGGVSRTQYRETRPPSLSSARHSDNDHLSSIPDTPHVQSYDSDYDSDLEGVAADISRNTIIATAPSRHASGSTSGSTSSPVQYAFSTLAPSSGTSNKSPSHESVSGGSNFLGMPKASSLPISPALSNASSFAPASSQSGASGAASSVGAGSPRSPVHALSSPLLPHHQSQVPQSSPRSPRVAQLAQQASAASFHNPASIQAPPLPPLAKPSLRRRASSLDLSATKERSPIPSRSATPPVGLGVSASHSPTATQYASVLPKTPPMPLPDPFGDGRFGADGRSQHTTPMVELPDEARRYIIAHDGDRLPSPVSPYTLTHRERHPSTPGRLGGLGISTAPSADSNLGPPEVARPRRASSALQAATSSNSSPVPSETARHEYGSEPISQIPYPTAPNRNGRGSPMPPRERKDSKDSSLRQPSRKGSGSLHDGHLNDSDRREDISQPSSPVRTARADYPSLSSTTSNSGTSASSTNQGRMLAMASERQLPSVPEQLSQYSLTESSGRNTTTSCHQSGATPSSQHTDLPPSAPFAQHQHNAGMHGSSSLASATPPRGHPHLQHPPPPRAQHQQLRARDGNQAEPRGSTDTVQGIAPLAHQTGSQQTLVGQQQQRCIDLVPSLLPLVHPEIINSSIRNIEKQRDVVTFLIRIKVADPPEGDHRRALLQPGVPTAWLIEKTWNDLLILDQSIKSKNAKANMKRVPGLPDKSLFRDHAPSKVDQRKRDLQKYLAGVCASSLHELQDFCVFLTSSIVSDRTAPVSNPGYKAGYLTKKGRNFGGWTTRFYILQGRMLEYYDTPGGQHLGSIDIKDASIGRQNANRQNTEDIRHAFLIRAKDKAGEEMDHILCAESDEERDHWVSMLVCCLTGEYIADTVPTPANPAASQNLVHQNSGPSGRGDGRANNEHAQHQHQQGQVHVQARPKPAPRKGSKDLEITRTAAHPISQLPLDATNHKLFGGPSYNGVTRQMPSVAEQPQNTHASSNSSNSVVQQQQQHRREQSAGQSSTTSAADEVQHGQRKIGGFRRGFQGSDLAPSASLPANLSDLAGSATDSGGEGRNHATSGSSGFHRLAKAVTHSDRDLPDAHTRPKSPEKRIKISGPSGGVPIGPDFKRPNADRKAKAKSSFWDFASRRTADRPAALPSRPVFGVPLQEAVEIARVREDSDLPAVVFRCVQYLSSVKAENEEGIYRLSGSSAVIKALKDRFNAEGDVDLTSEYFDPHAVAGLLKTFFRELPVHIFTNELNGDFVRANDVADKNRRIREVTSLVQQLPMANYSALRFLSAHLVKIVQKEHVNKMSVKNLGIVFSPTLAVPATLFALFITEFDRIFREIEVEESNQAPAVAGADNAARPSTSDGDGDDTTIRRPRTGSASEGQWRRSRNSMLFTQSGADRLLEMMNDLEDAQEEEEQYESQSDNDAARQYRSVSPRMEHPTTSSAGASQHLSGEPGNSSSSSNRINGDQLRSIARQKLTIDVHNQQPSTGSHLYASNNISNASPASPHSASASASASPRHLQPPALRSPGLPASPRHTEGFAATRRIPA